ncbi:type II secretion system protein GspK [Sphingomonas sp. HITSZ_GF]|uniref:general secretion pathway protein GspK n=1 Tax=Sphingomonas sp. HITSZ_GF TaxID=3037247 RepID=UPI00240E1484|nr:type II secretion system protein GspK [Sphingomonas sp. HITSZ_GF]MDG2533961.1 type II secretion system protein GspK [Sphingomonas sp. HITSZ_GF]
MSRRRTPSDSEAGMILVNVLMFVAIASGLVLLLINREEIALDRALRTREAARALAVVRGGELSALVALRRDMVAAPNEDDRTEPWAKLSENGAPIEGGTFDLAIADAEGRFNLNALRAGDAGAILLFQTIAKDVGLTPEDVVKAVTYIRLYGPLTDVRPIRLAGFDPEAAARLERLVTALPGTTSINLNAADPEMLRVLFRDPLAAQRLAEIRQRTGKLTLKDLSDLSLSMPWGTSFRSGTFWVHTRATIGGTNQQAAVLIQRVLRPDGKIAVGVVERWRGASVPPEAPGFGVGR